MGKVTMALCDVKPCTSQAEREFQVNGETFYVCGEQCFARFWSREYGDWKESRYRMNITFLHLTPLSVAPELHKRELPMEELEGQQNEI
jgi:hypothetical protein